MKVLFVQPPHYYGSNSRPPSTFPLGAAYIVSVVTSRGHSVEVLDIYAYQFSADEVRERINQLDSDFDVIGISALSTQYKYVKWLIKELKDKFDKPVIVGNALATFSSEALFKNSPVDICVISEGEDTMVDLLQNWGDLSKVNGIAYRQNNRIVLNPEREYIKDLDSIPFPKRDSFPMDIYLKYTCLWTNPEIKTMDIISARGCPYDCNFCSKTFKGTRLRSIDNIIQEIEGLRSKYYFSGVRFLDELALVNKPRIYELCKYLKKGGFSWTCQGRANLVDMDLLKVMKDSGCKALGFGIESGSQRILANMNKAITVEQAVNAIRLTKKAGIVPIIQMMHGYPGEDDSSLEETVDFFRKVRSPTMQFSMTTALPGTRLYNEAYQSGLIKNEDEYLEKLDWGYYGEREILINFTGFTETELVNKRKEIESRINQFYRKYLMRRPWLMAGILFEKVRSYYLRYGLTRTIKKMLLSRSYLKEDSWML